MTPAERARLLASVPFDPDPLQVQPDELVERRRWRDFEWAGKVASDARRYERGRWLRRLVVAVAVALAVGAWAGRATATSRPSSGAAVFRIVQVPSESFRPVPSESILNPGETFARIPAILDPATPTEPAAPPGDVVPDGELVVSSKSFHVAAQSVGSITGIASYYDWHPGEAAACGPLRAAVPDWRGRVVSVSGIVVRLTDFCPQEGRVIDLDDATFARLAPLSAGLTTVVVTW